MNAISTELKILTRIHPATTLLADWKEPSFSFHPLQALSCPATDGFGRAYTGKTYSPLRKCEQPGAQPGNYRKPWLYLISLWASLMIKQGSYIQ